MEEIKIRVARLEEASTVDGPGVRTVLWVQGCRRNCPGCQNPRLHRDDGGQLFDAWDLGNWLAIFNAMGSAAGSHLYTITGGEPFDQPLALSLLIAGIRAKDPRAHVVAYTGYRWEDLVPGGNFKTFQAPATERAYLTGLALSWIDVLVDGPYIQELDNDMMQYVGSSNQRVIDVQASLYGGELALLDWASEGMFTVEDGAVTMAGGWLEVTGLDGIGEEAPAPKCGQAERGQEHG